MTNTTKLLISAAFLTASTWAASDQSMTADIPFSFRAGDAVMAPGNYRFEMLNGNSLVAVSKSSGGEKAMILTSGLQAAPKEWRSAGEPMLAFSCAAGSCSLVRIWTGWDTNAVVLRAPHASGSTLTLIRLVRTSNH